ncbi:MAG: RNA polymerase factor sigma-54 [Betaproteobacteria bacterium]|nr:RNA polymerase factor sigma-54 [Betaproteobacteria bacterium]
MKPTLQLKLSQHLTLTPQLQQSIRLLQLSTLELNQEVERFLQENPLLERDDEGAGEDGQTMLPPGVPGVVHEPVAEPSASAERETVPAADAPEAPWADEETFASYGAQRDDSDEPEYPQLPAETLSLREHLLWQLNMTPLPERDKRLAGLLVDALNDDGYLTQPLEELAALLPEELAIEPEELQIALKHLQHFDPPGVGARTVAECLGLQLEALPEDTPYRKQALNLVNQYLDVLASRDFTKLRKLLHCDDACLKAMQRLITGLNPRPGSAFSTEMPRYVVPDVIVRKHRGVWIASLNPDAMPKLRINRMYAEILQRSRESGYQQLAGQLQEAKWLIKNVQQRFETILRVSQAIIDRQRHFFEHGEVAMRPLVLREIAEELDLHESTVSRVTTQKYMLTPRGIFELKYFFGSHVTTESGGACSATAIRALIKQLIGAEDARRPLSDSQISEILSQQGIVVARRTIAKYRESMQILPLNLRKSL